MKKINWKRKRKKKKHHNFEGKNQKIEKKNQEKIKNRISFTLLLNKKKSNEKEISK